VQEGTDTEHFRSREESEKEDMVRKKQDRRIYPVKNPGLANIEGKLVEIKGKNCRVKREFVMWFEGKGISGSGPVFVTWCFDKRRSAFVFGLDRINTGCSLRMKTEGSMGSIGAMFDLPLFFTIYTIEPKSL
jgi:hypothetical protein